MYWPNETIFPILYLCNTFVSTIHSPAFTLLYRFWVSVTTRQGWAIKYANKPIPKRLPAISLLAEVWHDYQSSHCYLTSIAKFVCILYIIYCYLIYKSLLALNNSLLALIPASKIVFAWICRKKTTGSLGRYWMGGSFLFQ